MTRWMMGAFALALFAAPAPSSAQEKERSEAKIDRDSTKWVKDAAILGMREVKLSEAVQDKLTRDDVKDFAKKMVEENQKLNDELAQLASRHEISLVSDLPRDDQRKIEKISASARGETLDKAYIEALVKDHEKFVKSFEKASKLKSEEVKELAERTLPNLRMQLDEAKRLQQALKSGTGMEQQPGGPTRDRDQPTPQRDEPEQPEQPEQPEEPEQPYPGQP